MAESRFEGRAVFLFRRGMLLAQFLGDMAFSLELGLAAAGLVVLHVANERSATLLRAAGWLLVVGATATALCTGYFWLRYHQAGEFEHAQNPAVMQEMAWSNNFGTSTRV